MEKRKIRKQKIGLVVSNRMQKTIVVAVRRNLRHAKYGKFIKRTSKFVAHDEKSECRIGDKVRIVETRPLSRTKRWYLAEILERGYADIPAETGKKDGLISEQSGSGNKEAEIETKGSSS